MHLPFKKKKMNNQEELSFRSHNAMNQLRTHIANMIYRNIKDNFKPYGKVYCNTISYMIKCDIRVVRDVNKKIINHESILIEYKERQKLKVTPQIRDYIESFTLMNRKASSKSCASKIKDLFNVKLSDTTVNVVRHELKFKYAPKIRTFMLTEEQKQARLAFAEHHLQNSTIWSNVLFTDESYFELGTESSKIWKRPGERTPDVLYQVVAHPKKLMIWGGISSHYKTELIIWKEGETMDAKSYMTDVFDRIKLDDGMNLAYPDGWVLQQDNAKPHTAEVVKEYFDGKGWDILPWSAHSPDLNIIEQVWGWMKRRIEELNPQTIEDLETIIIAVWESVTFEHIRNLVNSILKRLAFVRREHGGQITRHIANE